MIEYTQRITGHPLRADGHDAQGNPGDCFRCCLAGITSMPYDDVPHFVQHADWADYMRRWVRDWSHGVLDIGELDVQFPVYELGPSDDVPVILSGWSPRGPYKHCVIASGKTGDVLHDPHPSRSGIFGLPTSIIALVSPYSPDPAPPRMLTP